MDPKEAERRVIIRARVTDIPGDPARRSITLGDIFLGKPVNFQIDAKGYDYCLHPPDYYSDKPVSRWFIYDFNVTGRKSTEEQGQTQHEVYLACKQDDKWTFVAKDHWLPEAKQRSASFPWGGRREQEWFESMKATGKVAG